MKTTRAALLEALVKAGGEIALSEAADAIGLTASATHRQLALLVKEGVVHREGRQKEARYRLASCLHAVWTHAGPDASLAEEWTHRGDVDWRYPLVTRVPDEAARQSLVRLLEACSRRGVFASDASVNVYAYGSCVRGDAHAGSDVDVLLVHRQPAGAPAFPDEAVRDIVSELNLGVPRRLDVRVYAEDGFFAGLVDLYERVRKEILATAITIYSTDAAPRFIEAGRARLGEEVEKWTSGRA